MTREEFARKIRWPFIIALAGVLNVACFIPQIVKIYATHEVRGLSLLMFALFLFIQLSFGFEGFLKRSKTQVLSMLGSAVMSTTIIVGILYFGR